MEKNHYNNTKEDFALVDNNLANSQLAIGESSNLAQICLTYTYNFPDQKYKDYVCILSVIAQAAIDSAKRRFDIDINSEIKRIKNDISLNENGYPEFWLGIRKDFNKDRINKNLKCPMNCLYRIYIDKTRGLSSSIPMEDFFVKHELNINRRKAKKVEDLIQKYSLDLYNYNTDTDSDDEDYFLLRDDFDELLEDIRRTNISKTYTGLMSWLINRAFCITKGQKSKKSIIQTKLNNNKSMLLKVLYEVNPKCFLECFKKKEI